jgi:hypothetical protein
MKTLFILIVIALLFQGCKKEEKEIITKENNEEDTTQSEITITDESFIDDPFQFGKVTEDNLRNTFKDLKIEKEPIKNVHVKNQIDSILSIKVYNSEFVLYKLPHEQFLETAVVRDENIRLNKDIHIGMTKDQFKEKFDELKDHKNIPSRILIGRKETQEYLIFSFSKNRLKEIEYNGYVD